jgi:hypothetical protein
VDDKGLIATLRKNLDVDCDDIDTLLGDTWILIDDAQLAVNAERFWKIIVKDFRELIQYTLSLQLHMICCIRVTLPIVLVANIITFQTYC